ncbi:hypothetical protein GJ744_010386 [Endocarpon pusillum]|uniref:DUF6594 domain-containing protein n=1 Tax=Endocarpon pusillum TaxID=364733 RepID=A0A8H7ALT9_9EURO|nr:hypothetical protein GJ744_010386 [Endocarpon pusillum]
MTGYERLSRLIGTYPELAIYRKFSTLCTRLLLYKQAELQHLENELNIISQIDARDPRKSVYTVSWEALNEASPTDGDDLQRQKVLEIDEKMDKYYSALLKAYQVHSLAKPVECDISFLREWLKRPEGADYSIKGVEAEPWKLCCAADLVSLSRPDTKDEFAQSLSDKILPWYHHFFGRRQKKSAKSDNSDLDGIWEYRSEVFVALGNIICMMLSSIIPTASIFALHFVKGMIARLAVIAAMSFVFAFVMMVIVRGRRVEVFAATTAFAAVQVVFVDKANAVTSS